MNNINLLNDYIIEFVNEVIDLENDSMTSTVEEYVINNFYELTKHCFFDIKRNNKDYNYSDINFNDVYEEVIDEVRCQYGSEIDEIYIDDLFVSDLKDIITIIFIGE